MSGERYRLTWASSLFTDFNADLRGISGRMLTSAHKPNNIHVGTRPYIYLKYLRKLNRNAE